MLLSLIASTALAKSPEAPLQLPVNARHALVLENGSGKVLMAKDADTQVPIASLTKLMTAMVVLDTKADLKARIRIQREDVDTLKHSPSRVPVGAQMTRGAALHLALMSSDNRAAAALARTLPGGLPAFDQAVHAKIRALGLTRTEIAEPTGLSSRNRSTAAEMAKIIAAAARYPQISKISSDAKEKVLISGRPVEFRNTNRLVGRKGWDIRLSKTGYTEEAGRCLALRLKDKTGQDLTVVLLDSDGSAERLADAAKIRKSLERHRKHS
ncbi:serine hydrolase [Paucibacter sp. DJ2R-2]|uniref:serine hydrolase n=1 Tax=Paucibacter sp. DJ2R-2 TaxID=2893558 RepID=UPI0021E3DF02|nr:serine hydrolase [Paucibacter sp. DJ2R-2]MCV2419637.1 serine hydrolase [Paucibacter sp. DJ4R-1]MCV2437459.1 serine hydrolase [Paucibacter sp. DJ2R-2]